MGGGGVWWHFPPPPQKILKIRRSKILFPAISVIFLLGSLVVYNLYLHASNINGTGSCFFSHLS